MGGKIASLEEGAPSTHNNFVSAVIICKSYIGRKKTFHIILILSWCFLTKNFSVPSYIGTDKFLVPNYIGIKNFSVTSYIGTDKFLVPNYIGTKNFSVPSFIGTDKFLVPNYIGTKNFSVPNYLNTNIDGGGKNCQS